MLSRMEGAKNQDPQPICDGLFKPILAFKLQNIQGTSWSFTYVHCSADKNLVLWKLLHKVSDGKNLKIFRNQNSEFHLKPLNFGMNIDFVVT